MREIIKNTACCLFYKIKEDKFEDSGISELKTSGSNDSIIISKLSQPIKKIENKNGPIKKMDNGRRKMFNGKHWYYLCSFNDCCLNKSRKNGFCIKHNRIADLRK